MRIRSIILLFIFCVQNIVPAFAEDALTGSGEVLRGTGAILPTDSGSLIPAESTGAILPPVLPLVPLTICINEVLWAGSDLSTADEWLEITAVPQGVGQSKPQSLAGWTIRQNTDGQEKILATFKADMRIGSGEYLVISNYAASASRLLVEPAMTTTAMSLPNTKLQLRLRNASGALLDEVDDGIGAPFAGSNTLPKASMERIDCRKAGSDSTNWKTSIEARGLDDGALLRASPGYSNTLHTETLTTSASSTSSASSESSIPFQPLHKPFFNEILADPIGSDDAEWIELKLSTGASIDLKGWTIRSGKTSKGITASGMTLSAGQIRQFRAKDLGITLPNAGDELALLKDGQIIDSVIYPGTPEGVSYGRNTDGTWQTVCMPTLGQENVLTLPQVFIDGVIPQGIAPFSVNLKARIQTGATLTGAKCQWAYGDGYSSDSCNPPSHALCAGGAIVITLQLTDYCSNTVVQSALINLIYKAKITSTEAAQAAMKCTPSSFSGVEITEVLPHPSPGSTEWVELMNTSPEPVSLCGWSVDDEAGGSKPYRIPPQNIAAGQRLVLNKDVTNIAFNDDYDTVRIIAPLPAGGTGVIQVVPYQHASIDQSYAFKSIDHWYWSVYPTPGSVNAFQEVNLTLGPSPVILSAALPNPEGKDEFGEWVELSNTSKTRPLWLNGWALRTQSGKVFPLSGTVLRKREALKLKLEATGFTLKNSAETLTLIDEEGNTRSVLSWMDADTGKPAKSLSLKTVEHVKDLIPRTGFSFTARIDNPEDTHKLTVDLTGIEPFAMVNNVESENIFSALIKNKKGELQNSSINEDQYYLVLNSADVGTALLQSGHAIVTGKYDFARKLEYLAYEREARRNGRGMWAFMNEADVDERRARQEADAAVMKDGMSLIMTPKMGLVESGTVFSIKASVPSDVYVSIGSGAWHILTGSLIIQDDMEVSAYAEYTYQTQTGSVRSTVATQSYILKKDHYPDCIELSEIYPSPATDDLEWIELHNICEEEAPLLGWTLDDQPDGGSKAMTINQPLKMAAHSYRILSGSLLKITLNNGGDAVIVRMPNGSIASSIWYPSVKKGTAYALKGEGWCNTSTVTPGTEGICTVIKKAVKVSKKKPKKRIIGLKTAYRSELVSLNGESALFSLTEGLNLNNSTNNVYNKNDRGSSFALWLSGLLALVSLGVYIAFKKTLS